MRHWINIVVESSGFCTSNQEVDEAVQAFHGTYADFDKFENTADVGFHFGSEQAARDRLDITKRGKEKGSGRVYKFELDLQNPLRMSDLAKWSPKWMVEELVKLGLLKAAPKGKLTYEQIRQIITSAGYDGIVYANKWEGRRHIEDHEALVDIGVIVKRNAWMEQGSEKAYSAELDNWPIAYGVTSEEAAQNALSRLRKERLIKTDSYVCFRPDQIRRVD